MGIRVQRELNTLSVGQTYSIAWPESHLYQYFEQRLSKQTKYWTEQFDGVDLDATCINISKRKLSKHVQCWAEQFDPVALKSGRTNGRRLMRTERFSYADAENRVPVRTACKASPTLVSIINVHTYLFNISKKYLVMFHQSVPFSYKKENVTICIGNDVLLIA